MEFIKELKRLGLKDKEAAVYLSCLELGPATAQIISRKAKVVRATTYVELESLMQMGLITKFKQGKKTLFSAEPPRQLMRLLERRREEIQSRQNKLETLLPELQVLMKASGGVPSVRYFEGKEGLHAMRQEIVRDSSSEDIIYNLTPTDHLNAVFAEYEKSYYLQRAAKGVRAKTLFTTRSPKYKKELLAPEQSRFSERRFIPPERFPATSGMTIFKDKIAIGSFAGKLMGVIIESKPMADMMRCLFELAWDGAKDLTPPASL